MKEVDELYALQFEKDGTLKTLVTQKIVVGYKADGWFWIFVYPMYKGVPTTDYTLKIQYTLPESKTNVIEKLVFKNEYYNEYLKYTLSNKTKISKEAGATNLVLKFFDSEGIEVGTSLPVNVGVVTEANYHDDESQYGKDDGDSGGGGGGCDCDSDEHINKIIERIKPLTFNSVEAAETALNSGDIKNIYLGQSVIIVQNGEYELYSVQSRDNRYVVDPVDTYGESSIWEEVED